MLESFKDMAKIGMGAIWLSKDNLKKLSEDLAEMSKASKEEGERLFNEFEKNQKEYKDKLEKTVAENVKKAMDEAGLATKAEVDELKKKIAEMEARMAAQDQAGVTPETD